MIKKTQNLRCAWITSVFGMDGNLLYLDPLISGYSKYFSEFAVFTSHYEGDAGTLDFKVERFGRLFRLYKLSRHSKKPGKKYTYGINASFIVPTGFMQLYKWKPDLLLLNEFSLLSFYSLFIKLLRPKTKVLIIVECEPRTSGTKLLEYFRTLYRKVITRFADKILTNNVLGQSYLINKVGVPPEKIITQPYLVSDLNATTDTEITPHVYTTESLPLKFLYAGQTIEPKGIQWALKSFSMLDESLQKSYRLDIVGDGPYRETLEKLARELGIANNIFFHGKLPYQSLPEVYLNSDVFLFTTLQDYRALVPFEAMSFGLPIVASIYDGGIAETVDYGVNGFSFDPKRPEQLVEILTQIISNPIMLNNFSKRSFEMSKAYTLDNAIDALHKASIVTMD